MTDACAIDVSESHITRKSKGSTKDYFRKMVWDEMERTNVAAFPRPVHNRIPNFEGSLDAGKQIASLQCFKSATNVKVGPDKPLEGCRLVTLQQKKTLLVPTPRLRHGLLNYVIPSQSAGNVIHACATSRGVREHSRPLSLEETPTIDVVVCGSVAVSPEGWRIGKGEGYTDIEWAILASHGSIASHTPVVTVVHDCQVMDLPEHLFSPHDVTVDIIVTPTRIINCPARKKPTEINWSLLSDEKLKQIPLLNQLKARALSSTSAKNIEHTCTRATSSSATSAESITNRRRIFNPRQGSRIQ